MVFHNGKTNEDVIKLDIQDGSATFSGDIDTKKDVIIGDKLQMCQSNNNGYILFGDYASISGSKNDSLKLDAMHGVLINNMNVVSQINSLWTNLKATTTLLKQHIAAG